jgi:biotin carboxyl carrier protein
MGTLMPTIKLRSGDREYEVKTGEQMVLVDGGVVEPPKRAHAIANGETRWVFLEGDVFIFQVQREGRRRTGSHHETLTAPMPATVRQILVTPGDVVKKGDTLLVLEAMKMELPIRALADGRVVAIACREGELVQPGVTLVETE